MNTATAEDGIESFIDFGDSDEPVELSPLNNQPGKMSVIDDGWVDAEEDEVEIPVPKAVQKPAAEFKEKREMKSGGLGFAQMLNSVEPPSSSPPPKNTTQPKPQHAVSEVEDAIHLEIKSKIKGFSSKLSFDLGIDILSSADHSNFDPESKVHAAIWHLRWNSDQVQTMDIKHLCGFECVLTSHQVYVQSLENKFHAECGFLNKEKDRVFREARKAVNGATEKDKDNLLILNNQKMRALFVDQRVAEYMSQFMNSMGDKFSQMQNGLKRTIDQRSIEVRASSYQAGRQG